MEHTNLSRRDLLKVFGVGAAALCFPSNLKSGSHSAYAWPRIELNNLPAGIQDILYRTPSLGVRSDGIMVTWDGSNPPLRVPLYRTRWNLEHDRARDRLVSGVRKGVVLHWYGENQNFDRSIEGYLRGFNSLRKIGDYYSRTSAHFLVGDSLPFVGPRTNSTPIDIIQTQIPFQDGTPLVASHLSGLSFDAHHEKRQYFVRALYHLGPEDNQPWTLLQEMYDGPRRDPNMQTLAVEITGHDFDSPEKMPSRQKIANVLGTVTALLKRYQIYAIDILGHNEIYLGKADPGKRFLALIRYLVGIKAIKDNDQHLMDLCFAPFINATKSTRAVERYFNYLQSYLLLVSTPRTLYEWEQSVGYWNLVGELNRDAPQSNLAQTFQFPVAAPIHLHRYDFLDPENHEGIDFTLEQRSPSVTTSPNVFLTANGKCIFKGFSSGCQSGGAAIFRHRLPDGTVLLSVYSHLDDLTGFHVGDNLQRGSRLGRMAKKQWSEARFLHYAIAYRGTWETDLKNRPDIPRNAGPSWINERFIHPMEMLNPPVSPAEINSHNLKE